jgi:hypothetical protein
VKRLTIFVLMALLLAGSVFAQDRSVRRDRDRPAQVTIEGTLKLERGLVAVQSGDETYFVPMLIQYANFIDGIREGNNISIEGYVFNNVINPVKFTVGGNTYDFAMGRRGSEIADNNVRPLNPMPGYGFMGPQAPNFGRNSMPNTRNAPNFRSRNTPSCCW